jgi:DNA-binding NtrC family response regulator/nitrogen-specific signal transduction histidine kinase
MKVLAIGTAASELSGIADGTKIATASTVTDAVASLTTMAFDAVLVPKWLLDREGLDVTSTLRQANPTVALLLLAPHGGEAPILRKLRQLMLRAGLDDVVFHGGPEHDQRVALERAVMSARRVADESPREQRVLVVDDDQDVLDAVMEALQRAGIGAVAASDPFDALERLAESRPQVVMTDLKMPGLSGAELVAAAFRRDPEVVPIVFTGYATLENAVEVLRAGAFDFLVKPVKPDVVVACALRAFQQAQAGTRGHRFLFSRPGAGGAPIRLLFVEDSETDEELLCRALNLAAPARFQITMARSAADAATRLANASSPIDVVLLDLHLPGSSGLETFAVVHTAAPTVPVVVLTGASDDRLAEQVLLAGAQDFLVKGRSSGELVAMRLVYAIDRRYILDDLAGLAHEVRASDPSRRHLVERYAIAIVVVDDQERIVFANAAAGSLLGAPVSALIGARCAIPSSTGPGNRARDEVEVALPRPNGDSRWASVTTLELPWQGRTARFLSMVAITIRKTAEKLEARLAHADRLIAIGQLAAGVAHELNNPAAFVLANLKSLDVNEQKIGDACTKMLALVEERGDKELAAALESLDIARVVRDSREMIGDNLLGMERIVKIVRDLRGFSRIDQEDVSHLQLNSVITSACNLVDNDLCHRARLVKDLAPLPLIAGDAGRLGQVVVNLLVNASQAIEAGSPDENEVRVTTRHQGKKIRLTVTDTGRGISPEAQRRIFEPFFTTKGVGYGVGLGLSITHEIVAKHQGTITVASVVGKGTTFTVEIPEETGLIARESVVPAAPTQVATGRARVLIVDDEPLLGKALVRMLDAHEVVVAKGGQEALALLTKDPSFDVVLCDLMMPGLDGPALYDAIARTQPALAKRFVFTSGGAFTPRAQEFLARLPLICLDKPVPRQELLGVIAQLAGQRSAAGSTK